jgi:hypothetical protein
VNNTSCRHIIWLVIVGLFFASVTETHAQAFGFEIDKGRKKVHIPFELHNNLIVVPIVLNNAIPLRFIVDSGVKTAILTERLFSDILNIDYGRQISLMGADRTREIQAYVARNVLLDLPGVTAKSQSILVLEDDYLELSKNIGTRVHGIIGYELFRRFVVKIDYKRRYLTLYEPAFFKPKKKYTKIPIEIKDAKPYLNANLKLNESDSVNAKFLVDTGASHTVLLNMGSSENIELPDVHLPMLLGKGLGGDIHGSLGRIETIEFGPYDFNQPIISFAEQVEFDEVFKKTGRNGSVGGAILSRFRVIFDYFNESLYLKKSARYHDTFDYNMSGIDLITDGNNFNKFIVYDVAEDSPAHRAGIKKGDEVISINTYPSRIFNLSDFSTLFMEKENKVVRMQLKRDGEEVKAKFRLEKRL